MSAGADVRGYLCGRCSIISNGHRAIHQRFGLVYVDFATQRRIPESVRAVVCRFHCEAAGIAGSRSRRGPGGYDSGTGMTGGRTATNDWVLLAAIGGTNARFALMDRGEIGPVEHLKVADFSSATDAVAAFLSRHAAGAPPAAGALDVRTGAE